MTKTDKRVERTRKLLQTALIDLIGEGGYDTITIQDIVDRANIGRTTFYLHYNSKEDLFMSCREAGIVHFGPLRHLLTRAQLLSPEMPPGTNSHFQHLNVGRALLYPIFQGEDGLMILRRIRDESAQDLEASLRAAFTETDSAIPFDLLANYLAGTQIALMQWWLEKRQPYTLEKLAQTFHRLRRAAIRDALGLRDGEQTS